MKKTYKIAEIIISVDSLHDNVHKLCAEYEFSGQPEINISISQKDIDIERKKAHRETSTSKAEQKAPSDGYLETLAVYRKLSEEMLRFDTLLFHGSAIAVDGKAYVFTAASGTGKSTHTRLWRKLFGNRAVMINDDKPLIRISGGKATVYGTPWNGKHRLGTNTSAPLEAICLLERAEENRIEKAEKRALFPMILQQTYRPSLPGDMLKMISLADGLASSVNLYKWGCNMDISAAKTAYDGMNS